MPLSTSTSKGLSFLDLINACDNFHIRGSAPSSYAPSRFDDETLIPFHLSPSPTSPILGLLRPAVVDQLLAENNRSRKNHMAEAWVIQKDRISFQSQLDTHSKLTFTMSELCTRWRDTGLFPDVIGPKKWRGEMYPVYANPFGPHDYEGDATGNYRFEMERSACALFGIVTYGVHMTIYEDNEDGLKIWVPTRSKTKQTFAGMLDNSVAGGTPSGMGIFESLVKESMEEASIRDDVVRKHARAVGALSYFFRTAAGWLQPEVEYIYDLRVPPNVDPMPFQPKPLDGEVDLFELLPLEEVNCRMRKGLFKPNTALVLIDFFIRHGYVTPENEPEYMEIMTRLHTRFDYESW